jgi:transposase
MVTDHQVRRLFMEANRQSSKALAAAKSGMDEKTARKYLKLGKLPSQLKKERSYRTRQDPLASIWAEARNHLQLNPRLEAKFLFDHFLRKYPGKITSGQLRTFQRKVKIWKATEGPGKEVYFPQVHHAGELSASDFTHMKDLGVRINSEPFDHLIFHFVLTYSNWETGTICFSESFESLSGGLQDAFWKLGGVTLRHRTDSLSAAVHKDCNAEQFTARYSALLNHYGVVGERTNPGKAHENGDVEKSHHLFKKAVDQSLMLRGSRDFESREAYAQFIEKIFSQLNGGRGERFREECKKLRSLPLRRLDDFKVVSVRVRKSSAISVDGNVYSVPSRLIGEMVKVRIHAEELQLWYGDRKLDSFSRLRGKGSHRIHYRHIIDWLVRKPGAFINYRYRDDLFPGSRFRMVYDHFLAANAQSASKQYLKILHLAAREGESRVDDALRMLFSSEDDVVISVESVQQLLERSADAASVREVKVAPVNLCDYDRLLQEVA